MKKPLILLEVNDAELDAADSARFTSMLEGVLQTPKLARAMYGRTVIKFGRFDADARPNFVIPEVRCFTKKIDLALPCFCYFLPKPVQTTQLYSWFLSIAEAAQPIEEATGVINVDVEQFATLVFDRLVAVRSLCDRLFDDASEPEHAIFATFHAIAPMVREWLQRV